MRYLAVLGRQAEISLAELEAVFCEARKVASRLAVFETDVQPEIDRLGGSLKLAQEISVPPLDYLKDLPEGKLTIGVSDYSRKATKKSATLEAMKLKKILTRHGRSVRVVTSEAAVLSTATSLHNGFSAKNPRKVELIKTDEGWYRVIGVQDIDAYARRDQARPARDAKVGMLPPKLAQILINLCGPLEPGAHVLDPFCGTGVVLQEAVLMGYFAYGTDINDRMVDFSERNLKWLILGSRPAGPSPWAAGANARAAALRTPSNQQFQVSLGDATNFSWQRPIDAVACEGYLGRPFSRIPSEMELKEQKQICREIITGFLRNLANQIKSGTPVVIAAPAWLREDGGYSRLEVIDEIGDMGYNVNNKSREGLFYHREGQIVARDIIILRKD